MRVAIWKIATLSSAGSLVGFLLSLNLSLLLHLSLSLLLPVAFWCAPLCITTPLYSPMDAKQSERRSHIAKEVLSSERAFVRQLKAIQDVCYAVLISLKHVLNSTSSIPAGIPSSFEGSHRSGAASVEAKDY